MLHRHFSLSLDERLIEYRGVATPWSVGSKTNIFGGRIVPRSWAFFDGKLHPTEFQFLAPTAPSPTPTTESPELEFPKAFVREFYDFVAHRGLDGLLGLTLFDAVGGFPGLREVERTVGRVSVTMPMTVNDGDSDQGISTETAWTFGCHERMDDSELMNARVCWVCIKCK
ncbi:hypothetical protein BZA05DRAFT_385560 [Tricharina praecox]|uniref:uncharacterized protein n=1 Tax=Tricharina praecox TaxID=43433 RepID=UPI00221E7B27|nr:uncharacterized protein BZA05DRAFT_385560 [Tricharina praecox]KAI5858008.1 hypothetical protein BZA05DRAFT_385560 [Tricharina praecox]